MYVAVQHDHSHSPQFALHAHNIQGDILSTKGSSEVGPGQDLEIDVG